MPVEHLTGTVERVTFHNQSNGFCVLRVKVKNLRGLVTVIGSAASIHPGETIDCHGRWVNHASYGLQFQAEHLKAVPPSSLEGIEKYLASGMVRGIGPHFARKLVQAFGDKVFEVIEQQPKRLEELAGIGPKRRSQVALAFAERKRVHEIMVFLQSHGVGTSRAVRIYKTYGDEAIAKVAANPYRLARDIFGIGFKTADQIAQGLGIPKDSVLRARAGLHHTLWTLSEQGHCAYPRDALFKAAEKLLGIPQDLLDQALKAEIREGALVLEATDQGDLVYLVPLHKAEAGCARHILRLLRGYPPWGRIDPARAIPWVEAKTGLKLSPSQRQGLERLLRSKVAILTGGPGVGKTTLVNSLIWLLKAQGLKIALAAPTGRAAKRLSESVGLPAKTIHRLLEFDPNTFRFKHDEHHPLGCELLVVDEASMLDAVLSYHLFKAVPDRAAVLQDLIACGKVPTVRLTEVHRQAQGSCIVLNAHRIRQGRLPLLSKEPGSDFLLVAAKGAEDLKAKLLCLATDHLPKRFGLDPVEDLQVLCPMNRGSLGVQALNLELQQRLNPNRQPQITRFSTPFAPGIR